MVLLSHSSLVLFALVCSDCVFLLPGSAVLVWKFLFHLVMVSLVTSMEDFLILMRVNSVRTLCGIVELNRLGFGSYIIEINILELTS